MPGSSPGVERPSRQTQRCRWVAGAAGSRPSRLGAVRGLRPALILFGLFFLVPLGLIVAYSFWQTVDYNVVHDWTLDNYRYFFSVPTYVRTMWATVWVSFAATALTLADGVPVRLLARPLRAAKPAELLLVLVILPFWTSYLLRVYSWLNILGRGRRDQPLPAVDRAHRRSRSRSSSTTGPRSSSSSSTSTSRSPR